jgi:hypothetical protein
MRRKICPNGGTRVTANPRKSAQNAAGTRRSTFSVVLHELSLPGHVTRDIPTQSEANLCLSSLGFLRFFSTPQPL